MKKFLRLALTLLIASLLVISCVPKDEPSNTTPATTPATAPATTPDTTPATAPTTAPDTTPATTPATDVQQRYTYKTVVMIGVDGAGAYAADKENIDRIFANGAVNPLMLTAEPTISAQCWGTLLMGVAPYIHGLDNSSAANEERTGDVDYPTVFKLAANAIPDAKLAAFCNWSPIYHGIIESDIGVVTGTANNDRAVTKLVTEYLDENQPTLLFVQFDEADHTGHESGYNKRLYRNTLVKLDAFIGQIYDKLVEKGYAEDTLFIVTADHGGLGNGHGGDSDEEKYVFFGVCGKTIIPNTELSLVSCDVPEIIAYALGIDAPENWEAQLPEGLFAE